MLWKMRDKLQQRSAASISLPYDSVKRNKRGFEVILRMIFKGPKQPRKTQAKKAKRLLFT